MSDLDPGDNSRLLQQLALRYAAVVHAGVGICCGLVGMLSAEPSMRSQSAALVGLVIGWGLFYSRRLLRGSTSWLVVADVGVVVFVALNLGVTERPEVFAVGAGWVISWATFVCVTYQIHTEAWLGLGATLVVDLAVAVGVWRAAPEHWVGWIVGLAWLVTAAALCRWMWVLVQRGGRQADVAAETTARLRREREVAAAVRADEQRTAQMLHDMASTTLLMVGAGQVHPDDDWLPQQAARDLAALSRVSELVPPQDNPDLARALAAVIADSSLPTRLECPDDLILPGDVVAALAGAAREALTNALKYSGAQTATCEVSCLAAGVQVEVRDKGVGFDVDRRSAGRRGIARSIIAPMEAVGGSAVVESQPGAGTVVRLRSPAQEQILSRARENDEAATWQAAMASSTTTGLLRQLRLATLIITAAVLFALAPAAMAGNLDEYRSIVNQLVAFGLLALVFSVGVALFKRDLSWALWRWPAIGVVVLAGVLSAAGVEPTAHALASYWCVGTAPWLVLVILGERLRESIVVVVAHHSLAIARMVIIPPDGLTAGFLTGMITSAGYAIAIAVTTGTLASLARQAAQARRTAEEVRIADQLAAEAHGNRQRRYAELSATAGPLLAGLAVGSLDPQDDAVGRRCAVAAARMRRIFAETDEVPDPLLHELRECAEFADRRGVVVTLATVGTWPAPPRAVRRELTEAPLMLLATAAGQARVTVTGSDRVLAVSVVADCPDLEVPPSVRHDVTVRTNRHEEFLWVEAQWQTDESSQ